MGQTQTQNLEGITNLSLGGISFKLLAELTRWQQTLVQLYTQFRALQAKLLGGLNGQGPGLLIECFNHSLQSAQEEGTSILKQAQSSLISGIVGIGAMGVAGGAMVKNHFDEQPINAQLKDANTFRTELNKAPQGGVQVAGQLNGGAAPQPAAASQAIQNKIAEWKKGNIENFANPLKADGTLDTQEQQLNLDAVSHLRERNAVPGGDHDFDKIMDRIEKRSSDLKDERHDLNNKLNNLTQTANMLNSTSSAFTYQTMTEQAAAKQASGQESAKAQLANQNNSGIEERARNAEQQANAAAQMADQAAMTFAQLQQRA